MPDQDLIPTRNALRRATAYREIRVLLQVAQVFAALIAGIPLLMSLGGGRSLFFCLPFLAGGLLALALIWTAEAVLDMADAALARVDSETKPGKEF